MKHQEFIYLIDKIELLSAENARLRKMNTELRDDINLARSHFQAEINDSDTEIVQ